MNQYDVIFQNGRLWRVDAETYDHARRVAKRQAEREGNYHKIKQVRLVGPILR
jgi:hypothetical protein